MPNSDRQESVRVHAAAFQVLGEMLIHFPVKGKSFTHLTTLLGFPNDPRVLADRLLIRQKAEAVRQEVFKTGSSDEHLADIEASLLAVMPTLQVFLDRLPNLTRLEKAELLQITSEEMQRVFGGTFSQILELENTGHGRRNRPLIRSISVNDLYEVLETAGNNASESHTYRGLANEAAQFVRRQNYELIRDWAVRDREHFKTSLVRVNAAGTVASAKAQSFLKAERQSEGKRVDYALLSAASEACEKHWLEIDPTISIEEIAETFAVDRRVQVLDEAFLGMTD